MERLQGAHRTCLACARGILIEDGRAVRIPTEGQKTPRRTRSHVSTRKIEAALSVACPRAARVIQPAHVLKGSHRDRIWTTVIGLSQISEPVADLQAQLNLWIDDIR
jgi:hypothetical protein